MKIKCIQIPTKTICIVCKNSFTYHFTWFIGPSKVCDTCRKKGHREP